MDDQSQVDQAKVVSQAAAGLAEHTKADVLFFSGPIFENAQTELVKVLKGRQTRQKCLYLVIVSPGGFADDSYRVMRHLQENYETVIALVGGWCKSAATLCVIGANELVMSDYAELGPLDVQLAKKDELGERDSGLVINEAMQNLQDQAFGLFESFLLKIKDHSDGQITFKLATEVAASVTKGLFEPIYRQIDPIRIGETARSLTVAEAYGKRLNISAKNLREKGLESLSQGYPSHGFVIDRREANGLFVRVRSPNQEEVALLNALGNLCQFPAEQIEIRYLNEEYTNEGIKPANGEAVSNGDEDEDGTAAGRASANQNGRASKAAVRRIKPQ